MPGIIWGELDSVIMLSFGADLIREELTPRELDSTDSKEGLVERLEADIRQRRESTPRSSVDSTAVASNADLPFDPARLESLTRAPAALMPLDYN